jgi:hypothetical protein
MEDEQRSRTITAISSLPGHRGESREPWPAGRSLTFAGLRAPSEEFPVAVRVGSDGGILEGRGDAGELVGLAAYSAQVAEQIGDLLGMDGFLALEYPWEDGGRLVVCAAPDDSVIALRSRAQADLTVVREQLGLYGRGDRRR